MKKSNEDVKEKVFDFLSYFWMLLPALILIVGVSVPFSMMWNDLTAKENTITTKTTSLQSINYKDKISGSFVLGFGKIESDDYFVCYAEAEDGGLNLVKYDTAITTVYEILDENEKAYAEIDSNGFGSIVSIRMYVPKDTIQREYSFTE